MSSLARELHGIVGDVLSEQGVSRREQRESFELGIHGKGAPRVSDKLMQMTESLGYLLRTWHRDRRYLNRDGVPRVLPIRGRGATLESLARRFVPHTPVHEVVAAICKLGEVTKRRDNKVALVGSTFVRTPKSREIQLASLVTRIRRIVGTMLHNTALDEGEPRWFEHQVQGRLSKREFERYIKALHPQLADVCERAEVGLRLDARKFRHPKRRISGIGMYVFQEGGSS